MPFRKTHSSLGLCCLLTILGLTTRGATDEVESKVDQSVADTRKSLQNIDLMSKGISRSEGAKEKLSIDLSAGLQPSESVSRPVPSGWGSEELNSRSQRKKAWAAKNWLLAGVQEQSAEATGNDGPDEEAFSDKQIGRGGAESDTDHAFWLEAALAAQEPVESADRRDDSGRDKSIANGEIVNPLEGFFADWLAPSELERLAQAGGGPASQPPAGQFGATISTPSLGSGSRLRPAVDGNATEIVAENPYLQGWDRSEANQLGLNTGPKPAEATDSFERFRVEPVNRGSLPVGNSSPAEVTLPQSKEAWKPPPRTDEKYFPRLKRF